MGDVLDTVTGGAWSDITGATAAEAATEAGKTQAEAIQAGTGQQVAAQREMLEYLKQKEALPSAVGEQALTQLAGLYGIGTQEAANPEYARVQNEIAALESQIAGIKPTGGPKGVVEAVEQSRALGAQLAEKKKQLSTMSETMPTAAAVDPTEARARMLEGVMQGPLYQTMLGQGEEAILRHQGATGKLRSGSTKAALSQYAPNLLNQLYQQELQGIRGLMGQPTYVPQIAQTMGGIGQTKGQGTMGVGQAFAQSQLAAAQMEQQGTGNLIDLGLGIGGLYI